MKCQTPGCFAEVPEGESLCNTCEAILDMAEQEPVPSVDSIMEGLDKAMKLLEEITADCKRMRDE